jgi:hypothetical protein
VRSKNEFPDSWLGYRIVKSRFHALCELVVDVGSMDETSSSEREVSEISSDRKIIQSKIIRDNLLRESGECK